MNVMPTVCWMCLSSICISWRSLRSSAPSGSSSSSTPGRLTSARASATRCRCPPESWLGLRRANAPRRTSASASPARSRRSRLGDALDAQAVLDVLLHGHVREQRVVLEHGVDVALVGRARGDVAAVEQHAAARRALEAGDHAQAGRLARARRPEQREELAARDVEVDAVDGDERAEVLGHAVQPDAHVTGRRARRGAPDRRGLLHGCATIAAAAMRARDGRVARE